MNTKCVSMCEYRPLIVDGLIKIVYQNQISMYCHDELFKHQHYNTLVTAKAVRHSSSYIMVYVIHLLKHSV